MREYWIQTYTGKKLSLLDPQPEDICFEDIARSLSGMCRFNHHCRAFYSVAEHSVRVSAACSDKQAGNGLGHDFSEMLTGDILSPMKGVLADLGGKAWTDQLHRIERAFAETFGLAWPMPQEVKYADLRLLATEKRDLLGPAPDHWGALPPTLQEQIVPWGIEASYWNLVHAYRTLQAEGLIL